MIGYFLDYVIVFVLRINESSKYGIKFCVCNSENTGFAKDSAWGIEYQ
jgi:hypothetical protein